MGGLAALVAMTVLFVLYMFRRKKLAFATHNSCISGRWAFCQFSAAENWNRPPTILTKRENKAMGVTIRSIWEKFKMGAVWQ